MDRQNNEAKERKEGGKRKRKRKNEVTNISLSDANSTPHYFYIIIIKKTHNSFVLVIKPSLFFLLENVFVFFILN